MAKLTANRGRFEKEEMRLFATSLYQGQHLSVTDCWIIFAGVVIIAIVALLFGGKSN
jgi:hypothetical protein